MHISQRTISDRSSADTSTWSQNCRGILRHREPAPEFEPPAISRSVGSVFWEMRRGKVLWVQSSLFPDLQAESSDCSLPFLSANQGRIHWPDVSASSGPESLHYDGYTSASEMCRHCTDSQSVLCHLWAKRRSITLCSKAWCESSLHREQ